MNEARVALVTGASRGIGRAVALHLADAGFDVAALARPHHGDAAPCALGALCRDIESRGRRCLTLHADVADLAAHDDVVGRVYAAFNRLDVFVSNAGVAPDPRLDVLDMTTESFDRVVGTNLRGAAFLAQAVARSFVARPDTRRSILFITSVSAERSSTDRAEYCVSKAGLSMFARVLADRLAPHDVGVFEVRPGIIRTDMTAAAAEKYDRLIPNGLVPQGRWGEPDDVARVVVALARGDFAYSTGAIIDVSGGLSVPRL
ncbi:MAG: 3-ketoacyl-ACP reductase [Bacteroidales bacterium]